MNTETPSLTDLATALETANAEFETAKDAEVEAIANRKAAAEAQKQAQSAFNDAVNALKRRRAPKQVTAEKKPRKKKAA